MELGTSNNKAVLCNVIESQTNGFRHSKTRAGEQREQRAVSPSPQRAIARLGRFLDKTPDLVFGKNIRNRTRRFLAAKYRQWYFVALVLGAGVPGEANYCAESAGTLKDRFSQSGPFDGGCRTNVAFAARVREGSEGPQEITLRLDRKSASATYRQIRLHGFR
jgi:hypothetical protein